ncbi:serine/threonine-protein kinase [Thalassoglobus neptunius]|uniref:serine/threonine-protein kinase n=1 Tax=Thalassoglobus neptunius TaxID=1938619 RepID=UPI001E2A5B9F|nr:serine/threonine-protein kinase [Thalassoglobus neptunius]
MSTAIDSFIAAWAVAEETGPPILSDFLPQDAPARQEILVELIKIDLEQRWNEFELPKRLTEYFEEFPELLQKQIPVELVYEEYFCRQRSEPSVTIEDYFREFPDLENELRRFIQHSPHPTVLQGGAVAESFRDLRVGETIDDFDLLIRLGEGTFATVFLARQNSMQRLVAVKVSANKGTEPQTLAQLDHDYIVRVYDQRVIESPPVRLLYMQYLPGGTLESLIKRVQSTPANRRSGQLLIDVLDESLEAKGETTPPDSLLRKEIARMDWAQTVCWIAIRIAKALGYASSRGVLHRDLKPANVLMTSDGTPKLADFNISFSRQVEGASPAEYFGGSLAYMSPEQLKACTGSGEIQAEDLDVRSDLFSLGVVLWELLVGERPFADPRQLRLDSQTLEDMIAAREEGVSREKLEEAAKSAPPGLIRILQKSLHSDREQRWQTAQDMIDRLEQCLDPRARELIDPEPGHWQRTALRWTTPIILALNLIPNAFSAVGNLLYNQREIFAEIAPEQSFETILAVINGVAFPVGISIVILMAARIRRAIVGPEAVRKRPGVRRDSLLIGHRCALICLLLWVIAGFAYPVAIRMTGTVVPWTSYLHIVGSLVIFGLIATAYPFFLVTWFSLEVLYPSLLRLGIGGGQDRQDLLLLRDHLQRYLVMAASIPMLAVSAVTIVSVDLLWVAQLLCFGGLAAFAAAFWFYRRIEGDLDVFLRLSSPD